MLTFVDVGIVRKSDVTCVNFTPSLLRIRFRLRNGEHFELAGIKPDLYDAVVDDVISAMKFDGDDTIDVN